MTTETILREALSAGAGRLDVTDDPWPGFARRERVRRRSRRIRVAAGVAALATAIGVQTGVVPLPGWAPGFALAGRESALIESPARGSLIGDAAWLAGMRQEIDDVRDPGELWEITDRSKIRFLYAADVPGKRMTLALVPLRFGFLTDQALVWYVGPPGAKPAEMTEGGRVDGRETVVTYADSDAAKPGLVVVVAPAGSTIAVSNGFTYTAAGRVEHAAPVLSGGGIAEVVIPPAPVAMATTITVTLDGRTLYHGAASGGWSGSGVDVQDPDEAMLSAALAGRRFDRPTLRVWVGNALHDARLTTAGTTVAVRWTGTVNGQPAALFTLRQPGRGVLAYAMHGRADSFRQDLRLLLPAAGADRRPIAWRMRAEGRDNRTDQLMVVAPADAARATLNVSGAAPVPLTLDASGAATTTLDPNTAASVTAYAPDGTEMGSTPVPTFERDGGGLPGDGPESRVVK